MRNLQKTKNYKIESKCGISGEIIVKVANKIIRIIREIKRIIEIDQYYTNNGGTNSSYISKNDFNSCE